MTKPLWGVGSTAPYGHDGRSINLREVILRHGGEAQASRDAFAWLSNNQQALVIEFLQSLVLFGPSDSCQTSILATPIPPTFHKKATGTSTCPCYSTIQPIRNNQEEKKKTEFFPRHQGEHPDALVGCACGPWIKLRGRVYYTIQDPTLLLLFGFPPRFF